MRVLKYLKGYAGYRGLALLLAVVLLFEASPSVTVNNRQVRITFGPPEAYAAGTADYSLGTNGATNTANTTTAINTLPSQGGLFHFKVGTFPFTGNVTRAFGNMTIEGEGKGTYFTGTGMFVPGGSNWVLSNLAYNFTSAQLPQNATWDKIYTIDYPNGISKDANGVYTVLNITATQLTATTGYVTTLNAPTLNLTSNGVIWHEDIYGTVTKIFQLGGTTTGFGYQSAIYFGPNTGNSTSNASFQGGFGIGVLAGSNNQSEGNWGFGDVVFATGTNLQYNNGMGDGTGRYIINSRGANLIGDHVIYENPASVNFSAIMGGGAFRNTASSLGDVSLGYQNGYNNGVAGGVSSYNVFLGHQAGYNEINSANKFYINNAQGGTDNRSSYIYGNMAPRVRTFELGEAPATAGLTTQNGQRFTLNAYYWNGSASTTWNATIQHLMSATTPDSYLNFTINGSSGLRIRNNNGTVTVNTSGILTNDTRIDAPTFYIGAGGNGLFFNDSGQQIYTSAAADMNVPIFNAWNGTARVAVFQMHSVSSGNPYMDFVLAPKFSQNGTPSDNTTIKAWVKIINGDGQTMYLPAYK